MKQTMKWILINEQEDYVVFRCSVCNSEISVKYGEELPYCKHCECEPEVDGVAIGKITENRPFELTSDEKILVHKPWDCAVRYDPRETIAQQQKTIEHQEARLELYRRDQEKLIKERDELQAEVDKLTFDYGCYKAAATDLVEQLKGEIEALIAGQETLQKYIVEKDAEIERLQHKNAELQHEILSCQSEAVKEFVERLKSEIVNKPSAFKATQATVDFLNGLTHRQHEILDDIDNLVKEMVGEDETPSTENNFFYNRFMKKE